VQPGEENNVSKKGMFITFEGGEGSGKSTHSKLLCDFLRRKGLKVLHTREPGGTSISEKIRKVLLDTKNKEMDVISEMLLYMAARAEIIKQKISPALKRGNIVICDRFIDATLAYQGYAGGIDISIIKNIGRLVTKSISPDVTFFLDIDVKKGLKRSGRNKDRIERKSILYHKKVRKGYLSIAKKEPKRVKVISSIGKKLKVQDLIRKELLCHLKI